MNNEITIRKMYMEKELIEFLKYVKMSTHLFNVTQATNYDTATTDTGTTRS